MLELSVGKFALGTESLQLACNVSCICLCNCCFSSLKREEGGRRLFVIVHYQIKTSYDSKNTHTVFYGEEYKTILPVITSVLAQMVLSALLCWAVLVCVVNGLNIILNSLSG